ncbi:MAG: CRISPR-associated protein Cas4 [Armatimonadetes bacterium]|nr:CRISPR-associated protein Cas4 [Armatimonadota bacterium]
MFDDEDLLPLSAIRHVAFCERRAALVYIEHQWAENRFTAEGELFHEQVHLSDSESRGDVRIVRGLPLRSARLGLVGKADVVEFHRCSDAEPGIAIAGATGLWRPFPIEYRVGVPALDLSDHVQLCAQALCLEEMLGIPVPAGAIFYGRPHRRQHVDFTPALRAQTENFARRLHELLSSGITPPPHYQKRCRSCSLNDLCLPRAMSHAPSARRYLDRCLASVLQEGEE